MQLDEVRSVPPRDVHARRALTVVASGDATHDALADARRGGVRQLVRRGAPPTVPVDPRTFPPPRSAARAPRAAAPARRRAIGVAHRARCRVARDARLPCAAGAEHGARRSVRQPHQHEPARGQGLHLRGADVVRVPPRPWPVRAARERAVGRHGRRRARSDLGAARHPRRPAGDAARSSRPAVPR